MSLDAIGAGDRADPLPEQTHAGRFAIADTLRLLAILAVVLSHLTQSTQPTFSGKSHNFDYLGIWGIAAFFVLSGYLLSKPYLRYLLHAKAWPDTKLYLQRRFLRIVPLYWFALAFSVVALQFVGKPSRFWDVVAHAAMLQDFSVSTVQTINPPFWTMPVDFEFYLALPILAYVAFRILQLVPIAARPRTLAALMASATVTSIIYRVIVQHSMKMPGDEKFVFLDNGFGIACAFLIGATLEWIFDTGLRPSQRVAYACVGLAVFLYFAVAKTLVMRDAGVVMAAFAAALLLYALPFIRPVLRFSQHPWVAVGASFAYAIYLFHFPILEATYVAFHLHHGNSSFAILSAFTVAALLPIAYLAHRFVERPFLLLKDRKRESSAKLDFEIVAGP